MNPHTLIGGSTPQAHQALSGRFDAYCATVFGPADAVFDELLCLMESAGIGAHEVDGGKVKFYARNRVLVDDKGHRLLAVKSGGANPHPHVECKGYASPLLGDYLRGGVRHRPTRVDHAVDRRGPELFDELLQYARELAKKHRLRLSFKGDWSTPDAGRTIELGSRASQVFVRIYEKGLEYAFKLGIPVTDELREWVRIELEFKPQTQTAKALAPTVTGAQLWGATQWTDELAREVLSMATEAVSIRERRESNRDRALRFMGAQYAAHLRSLLTDCKGDLAEFGHAVADLANLLDQDEKTAA